MENNDLQIRNLRVWLGKNEIIKDVSFVCEPELIGILGDNGSGKTTLIKGILQLGDRQEGQVILENTLDIGQLSQRKRAEYLSYVPQETKAVHCSVMEFAAMGRNPYLSWLEKPKASDYRIAEEALGTLEISHLEERCLDELSGGERKLAYLARARVQNARWMLLDEPTAGLDFKRQHLFLRMLRSYRKESGCGAIFSIHDPLLAYTYCDRVLLLKEGKLAGDMKRTDESFRRRFQEEFAFAFETAENRSGLA